MTNEKKKALIERIIIAIVLLVVIGLLVYFLKDVFFPFLRLEIDGDGEGAKKLLISKGFLGMATVSLVEALQMVVIFVPAEFIQLSSGMSYPWWLAVILCDSGVVIGCSIIFFIVRAFKFDGGSKKRSEKIAKYEKAIKTDSTPLFMYILFIMPVIPFGLICYWAANRKISYGRYVLTCATGVLPSILTSILMGAAAKEFITRSLPLWLLILIIIAAAAFLFILLAVVLYKFCFKKSAGTPDSPLYSLQMKLVGILAKRHLKKINVKTNGLENVKAPYLLIANHHSYIDFYCASRLDPEARFALVTNRFYYEHTFLGKIMKKTGAIPKKLFTPDVAAVKGIIKAIKDGYPVLMFPEGRLSADGSPSPVPFSTASLCKLLGVPVVIANIKKAYFIKPKWRKRETRGKVDVEVKKILNANEIENMGKQAIYDEIVKGLAVNEFDQKVSVKSNKKAEGLENLLYMCPECHGLYTNKTEKNTLYCSSCGAKHVIGEDYSFVSGKEKNLQTYNDSIKAEEEKNIDDIKIDIEVDVKIFTPGKKKPGNDEGVFFIDKTGVSYKSKITGTEFGYKVSELEAIAFSAGEEFEFYYENELYYFYPKEHPEICARISMLFDILRERETKKQP